MPESTDLIRRLDSAISTKSLHPEYARGLLREARDALTPAEEASETMMRNASWYVSHFAEDGADEPT